MNDNLTCTLVRDLLPSYLEGLTAEETNEALERHLAACPACAAALETMRAAPEPVSPEPPREVDYLKEVKRQNRKRVVISVLATAAGLLMALLLKVFVIGTPLQAQTLAVIDAQIMDIREDHGRLQLRLSSVASANAYHGWRVETVDGVASIYAREVMVSTLYNSGDATIYVPLEGVDEVWLGGTSGRLVWQDGMLISRETLELLAKQTPYCGDPSTLGGIGALLRIHEYLGEYTVTMQTSRPPYGWTLEASGRLNDQGQDRMTRHACVMLALVDNLDEVSWTWRDDQGTGPEGRGTLFRDSANRKLIELTEEYNALHGTPWAAMDDIRDYTRTPADFQRMLELLGLVRGAGG
ncbi:MAG: DUF4825 domain-containing protein [Oscillibacter sp.]|nr:DUF4825 domain-containing protein [Oscillibacter sp.]